MDDGDLWIYGGARSTARARNGCRSTGLGRWALQVILERTPHRHADSFRLQHRRWLWLAVTVLLQSIIGVRSLCALQTKPTLLYLPSWTCSLVYTFKGTVLHRASRTYTKKYISSSVPGCEYMHDTIFMTTRCGSNNWLEE